MAGKEYDFARIEKKWQKYWDENRTFRAEDFSDKEKFYCQIGRAHV